MRKRYIRFCGFSLIEVLIGLFILSFILLGFDVMEIFALRQDRNSYLLSIAENQLYSMIERLHVINNYEGLTEQVAIWNAQNQVILPQGKGIVIGKFPNYIVSIFWGSYSNPMCNENQIGLTGCLTEKVRL